MFVQVRLVTARDASVVAVPQDALYYVAGLTKIFAIRDGKAVESNGSRRAARWAAGWRCPTA